MTLALTRRQRAGLLAISALAYVFGPGLFGETLFAHDGEGSTSAVWSVQRTRHSPPVGTTIRRDPFAGKPLPSSERPEFGTSLRVPDIGQLPPADAAAPEGDLPSATFELKATIAGARAVAYVQNGSAIEIVHVGSRLGERTIRRIGLRGIVFDDGSALGLSARSAAPRGPVSKARTEFDELRRLIVTTLRHSLPSGASPERATATSRASPPSPSTPPFATMPPAAALPTIVPDFLPVGVSPTSDPNGPTPYPLPPLRPLH